MGLSCGCRKTGGCWSPGPVLYPNIIILYLCHGLKNVGKHCSTLRGCSQLSYLDTQNLPLRRKRSSGMDQWQIQFLKMHNFGLHIKGRAFISGRSKWKVNKTRPDWPLIECFSFVFLAVLLLCLKLQLVCNWLEHLTPPGPRSQGKEAPMAWAISVLCFGREGTYFSDVPISSHYDKGAKIQTAWAGGVWAIHGVGV